eukprot:5097433-Pleurochrysis_carterae.AAC.2
MKRRGRGEACDKLQLRKWALRAETRYQRSRLDRRRRQLTTWLSNFNSARARHAWRASEYPPSDRGRQSEVGESSDGSKASLKSELDESETEVLCSISRN